MVVSLQQGANDLQMVQMMPLPLYRLSLRQNPDWFNFSGVGLPRLTPRASCQVADITSHVKHTTTTTTQVDLEKR